MKKFFAALAAVSALQAQAETYLRECAPTGAAPDAPAMVVIGDSYVQNHKRPTEETWHYKLAVKRGMNYFNYGRNGNCLAFDRRGWGEAMINRMDELHTPAALVIVIAGHNDAGYIDTSEYVANGKSTPEKAARKTEERKAAFRAAVGTMCDGLKAKYPDAQIVWVSPWQVDRPYFDFVIATEREICAEKGVEFVDATATSGISPNDPQVRKKLFQGSGDTAHLNRFGHDRMLAAMEKRLAGERAPAAAAAPAESTADEIAKYESGGQLAADPTEVEVDAPKDMKLILCIGQSNMAGRGKLEDADREVVPGAYKLDRDGKWVAAKSPYHFDRQYAAVGPVDNFVREYLKDHPGETVGVVPCAVGGSPVRDWDPKRGKHFARAMRRAKIARENGEFIAILWHQGETDAAKWKGPDSDASKAYPGKVKEIVEAFRAELGDVPAVVGEIGHWLRPDGDHGAWINPAIRSIPEILPISAAAGAGGLKNQDRHHFDRESQIELGRRYYEAWKQID